MKKTKTKDKETSSKCDSCTKSKCTNCQDKKGKKIKGVSKSKKTETNKELDKAFKALKKETNKTKVKKVKKPVIEIPTISLDKNNHLVFEETDGWYVKPIKKSSGLMLINSEHETALMVFLKETEEGFKPVLLIEREGLLEVESDDETVEKKLKAVKTLNSSIQFAVESYMN